METLATLGSAVSAMVPMRDGTWTILIQTATREDGEFAVALNRHTEADGPQLMPHAEFEVRWSGILMLARHAPVRAEREQPFGPRWFMPELFRHRRLLAGVAMASVVANLIAFGTPLLLQVLIEVVHEAWSTLVMVVTVFVTLSSFEVTSVKVVENPG